MNGKLWFVASSLVLAACRTSDGPTRVHKASDDNRVQVVAQATTTEPAPTSASTAPSPALVALPSAPPPTAPSAAPPAEDSYTAAYLRAKPWIEGITQKDDALRRASALDEVTVALRSNDEREIQSGLIALTQTAHTGYDSTRFRELVLPHLSATDPTVRRAVFYALHDVGQEPRDLERALKLADDPSPLVRESAAHLITMFAGGELTGAAAAMVGKLLRDPALQHATLRGIWGARVARPLEAQVLELSNSPDADLANDALYFAVSTFREKSDAVVARLIEVLGDEDVRLVNRAMWGLEQGVPERLWPRVADAALGLAGQTKVRTVRLDALRIVGRRGNQEHAAKMQEMIQAGTLNAEGVTVAEQSIEEIGDRVK